MTRSSLLMSFPRWLTLAVSLGGTVLAALFWRDLASEPSSKSPWGI